MRGLVFKALWGLSSIAMLFLSGCGLGKRSDALVPDETAKKLAAALERQSNYNRASGLATSVRVQALFPTVNAQQVILGEGATYGTAALSTAFVSKDRPIGALAQIALRTVFEKACASTLATENRVFDEGMNEDSVWLSGETPPADPTARLLVVAARRVWLYPFLETDEEVGILKEVYDGVFASSKDAAKAKNAVCQTALSAPHFWLGVPRPDGAVAKLALEIGHRLPKFREYSQIRDGELTVEEYVKRLQQEGGYIQVVSNWHEEWLDFQAEPRGIFQVTKAPPTVYVGEATTAANIQNIWFNLFRRKLTQSDGSPLNTVVAQIYHSSITGHDYLQESCTPRVQAFNPKTSKLVFELWNATSQKWDVLGSHEKVSGVWIQKSGNIVAPGVTPARFMGMEDVWDVSKGVATVVANGGAGVIAPEWFARLSFEAGAPVTSVGKDQPTYEFSGGAGGVAGPLSGRQFLRGNLRVRRFDDAGVEQNGYSPVLLPWSREVAYVCNTMSRHLSSCAYRYQAGSPPISTSTVIGKVWTDSVDAKGAKVPPFVLLSHGIYGYAHGQILDSYACGIPSFSEIKRFGQTGYNELVAFPKTAPYNDVGINIYAYPGTGTATDLTEYAVQRQIAADLGAEPYRLLEDVLKKGDYRKLLTADYSFGTRATQYYMQTQAYPLPVIPTDLPVAVPGDATFLSPEVQQYSSKSFVPISRELLRGYNNIFTRNGGGYFYADAGYKGLKLTAITPRPMSGIMTQTAFIGPMYPKIRSLAARVFARLMCTLPSSLKLSSGQAATHANYLVKNTVHLNEEKGCYGCHVHLDPLGRALSKFFTQTSDIEEINNLPYSSSGEMMAQTEKFGFWGIRGSSEDAAISEGAFLGAKVRGVVATMNEVAQSDPFARCAVSQAFHHLFGRPESFSEAKWLNEVIQHFKDSGYDYNAMVLELATSKEFLSAK